MKIDVIKNIGLLIIAALLLVECAPKRLKCGPKRCEMKKKYLKNNDTQSVQEVGYYT